MASAGRQNALHGEDMLASKRCNNDAYSALACFRIGLRFARCRSFEGCAFSGPMKGQCLRRRIDALKDFWFDWQHYHPDSSIYRH